MRKTLVIPIISLAFISGDCNVSTSSMTHEHTNQLIHESSPYLLQHAHNPVDWHPWGKEALQKAETENKLVLVSVGYSACHWCHVMEHETFEDSTAAAFMNDHFINIKVDREERPDVDQVYMNAVQLMTKRGGWPLNCFTLPDGRPIYGGTYFQKDDWMNVLSSLVEMKEKEPEKMLEYAANLTTGIQQSELIAKVESPEALATDSLTKIVQHWSQYWDRKLGGPNRAPKFPLPNSIEFLLHYGHELGDQSTLEFVHTTLEEMARGGIYDQVGGGFARYSTDINWKVPHFEKMLYDNAQLVTLYSRAFQQSGKVEYERVVRESLSFVERELMDPDALFYSALDADSEGEEGKFYVWSKEEMKTVLGEDFDLAQDYFNLNHHGKWEGHFIPLRKDSDTQFAETKEISLEELNTGIEKIKNTLLEARASRIRPGLDDKSLTSWNALMVSGYLAAHDAFGDAHFLEMAKTVANRIWKLQRKKDGALWHNYKGGKSSINGYLEDYSFTIEAFVNLYQITYDEEWLTRSRELADYVSEHFYDEDSGMFWFTSDLDPPLIARKQELEDNVIPASNSSLAKALHLLGTLTYDQKYLDLSAQMLDNIVPTISFGQSYSNWGILHLWKSEALYEVAITGDQYKSFTQDLRSRYIPNMVTLGAKSGSDLPLLEGKFFEETTIFVCQNKACQLPVKDVESAVAQME